MIQDIITYIIVVSAFAYAGYGFVKLFLPNKEITACAACSASVNCGLKAIKEKQISRKIAYKTAEI